VRTSSYYLPFSRNRRFVGRSDELEELRQKLLVNKECQKIAVIGLGGIGKTQVALEFAQSVKEEKPEYSIFWVPALSLESFEQACTEIVRILPIARAAKEKEDAKELVRQYLSAQTAGKWLLIVDNADDTNVVFGTTSSKGIVDYLPESEDGLTIFTSRRQEVAGSLVGSDVLKLGKMSDEDAVAFIQSLVWKDLAQDNAITELLTELDYLPLAIAQAVAYINKNEITFASYLRLLKNTDEDIITLMSGEFRDSIRYKQSANAVATTWVVSFNQILKEDATAADLLAFISCIEWKAIPRSILPTIRPEARLVDAIGTICSYSFMVKRDNEEVFDMHRLVHLAIRIWLDRDGRRVGIRKKAIEHVAEVFPSNDYENRNIWREYLPHASQLLIVDQEDSAKAKHKDSAEAKRNLLWKVRRCLQTDGRIKEAVKWFEESCQWADDLPEDNPSRLASQHALAEAYRANGQVREAVALLEHVVAVQKRVLAEDHPNQLGSQHALAVTYRANGQVKEAVVLLEHVVTVRERILAEDHPDRLGSQHALALTYRANGQVKKAIALLEHVVTVHKQVLAEDHPDRLASQHALAVAYQANGQVKEAVALLEYVVAAHKQVLAEDHPDRLGSQLNLARGYRANGQVKEAVALLKRVVAKHKQVFAEDHPDLLLSQHALALAYQANGQVKEAVALLKHIDNKQVLAEDNPDRLASQHALALAYQANGQMKEAVALLKHVVVVRERVLAEDHPDRLESQHALANMMQTDR
jgi:tetratricopeptide (TPR) repeat protein